MKTTILQAFLVLLVLAVGVVLLINKQYGAGGLTVGVCAVSFWTEIWPNLRKKR